MTDETLENTEETKPTGTEDTSSTQSGGEEQGSSSETNPDGEGEENPTTSPSSGRDQTSTDKGGEGSEQGSEDPAPEPAKPVGAYDSLAAEKVSMNAMLFGTLAHQDNYIYSNTKKK